VTFEQLKDTQVDVFIPVYKPDNKLNQLLLRMEKQTIRPRKIYILQTITDMSRKEVLDIPKDSSIDIRIVYIKKEDFDHGGTRKFGASLSNADILMFMTQDAIPVDELLIEKLIEPYRDSLVSATYARQLANSKADIIERYTRDFNYPKESIIKSAGDIETLGIKAFFCSNVCATYRRDIYERLGGFVQRTIFNEDMIMAHTMISAGYKIAYQADARVIHSHVYSYLQQFSRNFDLGVSHRQYANVFLGVDSKAEGLRLVKSTLKYLIDNKEYLLIPDLIISSGMKYLGYKLGVNYNKLPKELVIRCTMNKGYWKNGVK
jgi:rhamnosyltransferase